MSIITTNWQPLQRRNQLTVGNKVRHPQYLETPAKIAVVGKMKTHVGHRSCVILETAIGNTDKHIISHFMEIAKSERLEISC